MNNNFPNIRPFRFWVQSVLPLVYDDSLSYYEVLSKLTQKVNDIIAELGTIPDEIKNEINEYINSDEFKSYVETIVAQYVPTELEYVAKSVDVQRVRAEIKETAVVNPLNANYVYPQSCTFIEDKNTVIVCFAPGAGTLEYDNFVEVVEYNLSDFSVARRVTCPFDHANSIAYNSEDKKLYIAGLKEHMQDELSGYCVIVADYETLNVEKYAIMGAQPVSVAYDNENKEIYIKYKNSEVQVFDKEFNALRGFYLNVPEYNGASDQDMCFADRKLYTMQWRPNIINVYDKNGINLCNFNIPEWWNKYYRVNECEGITYLGNDVFLITATSALSPTGYQVMASFGKISFDKGMPTDEIGERRIDEGASSTSPMNLYVDSSYTGNNPIGNSTDPFRSVQEALETLHSPWIDRDVNIYLNGTEPYPVEMRGLNRRVNFVNAYNFKSVKIDNCFSVTFSSVQHIEGSGSGRALDINNTEVVLSYTKIEGGAWQVYCNRGKLIVLSYPKTYTMKVGLQASEGMFANMFNPDNINVIDTDCSVNVPVPLYDTQFSSPPGAITPRLNVLRFKSLRFSLKPTSSANSKIQFDIPVEQLLTVDAIVGLTYQNKLVHAHFAVYFYDDGRFNPTVVSMIDETEQTSGLPGAWIVDKIYGLT